MPTRSSKRLFLCCAVFVLCLAGLCFAQSERATISGRVTDPSGAAIPGAEVAVTNTGTHFSATTRTNDEGLFVLPSLQPGPYRLSVSKPGFKTVTKVDLILHVQGTDRAELPITRGICYRVCNGLRGNAACEHAGRGGGHLGGSPVR